MISQKLIFAQAGIPKDRLQFLRTKFYEDITSEATVRMMKQRFPVWGEPTNGEDLATDVKDLLARVSPKDIAMALEFAKKYVTTK